MTKPEGMTKQECRNNLPRRFVIRLFGLPSSFVIRASSLSLDLPVFDELGRDFFQESRRPLKNIAVTGVQSRLWIGEIKFILRAGDGDVKEAPLFFERVARVERTTARKHAVGQPDHEHGVKL